MPHLIVPFATAVSEAGRHAAGTLQLPHLERLLAHWTPHADIGRDEHSLSAPHELVLAHALGWPAADGLLPLAAHAARRDGLDTGTRAVGLLTPVHLHLGTEQISLADPDTLALDAADARALFDALQPLFADAGFDLRPASGGHWYLLHDSLATLPTASLDRVVGRNIDPWLPDAHSGRAWRRLQSEAQMLLYTHEVNTRREAQGLPSVNSLWLSGTGAAPPAAGHVEVPQFDERLRAPALAEDWAAWADAWRQLDAGPIAQWFEQHSGTLTLAGERRARSWTPARPSPWQRLKAAWPHGRGALASVLETL
ncbi:MAG: hypothetical protein HS128_14620 [Ideonella sp.]|nr:hypothetical protein [Ideonella sp.]MCC7456175.1 hypothetical protein [Nitrospira sp.]